MTPSPALVSQQAVQALPRWLLWLFGLAYVLPGLIGRQPWKNADLTAFGAMQSLAQGAGSWWQPNLLGVPLEDQAWLPYWLGAWAIKALAVLGPEHAARVPFGLLLGLALVATWYATYHLARSPAAQPVSFAFGGEAQPTDYARALADGAFLALLASLGLAQLGHETTPAVARLGFAALCLWGAARATQASAKHRLGASWLIWMAGQAGLWLSGAGWSAMALSGLTVLALRLVAAPTQAMAPSPGAVPGLLRRVQHSAWASVLIGSLGLHLLAWASGLLPALVTPVWYDAAAWSSWGRLLLWFSWPAWPLVLWTCWRWRGQWRSAHVSLPLALLVCGLVASALHTDRDRSLLLALPAMAALAAFALPTLRRSVASLIDWFTLLFFSACALVIWTVWLAMHTGWPAKPAANVAKLAPGFVADFSLFSLLLALLASAAWLGLVAWRAGRDQKALWKTLVLPAAGSSLCWLLLNSLWLPLLDHALSYRPVSQQVAHLLPRQSCVLVDHLKPAQWVALSHHGQLRLVRSDDRLAKAQDCQGLVTSQEGQATLAQRVDLTQWAFKARVYRLRDRKEHWLVYQRIGTPE